MSLYNHNWYNLNATRDYPLDSRATQRSDAGRFLPQDILVDLQLRFPCALGRYAYLSGVRTGPEIATLTIVATPEADAGFTLPTAPAFQPIAAITVLRPEAGRSYRLEPLADGVGGWVVFGPGCVQPWQGIFTMPRQGLLAPRAARVYGPTGLPGLGRWTNKQLLEGVVTLVGEGDLQITVEEVLIEDEVRRAIVLQLASPDPQRNVLELYTGPCNKRPESGTCPEPGIELINTVAPDCQGNLTLEFRGGAVVSTYQRQGDVGLIVDYPFGLTEACTHQDRLPDIDGRLPNEYPDNCSQPYDQDPFPIDDDLTGTTPPVPPILPSSSALLSCAELPYTDTFDDGVADDFFVNQGEFEIVEVEEGDKIYSPFRFMAPGPIPRVYRSGVHDRSLAVWDNCALYDPADPQNSAWSACKTLETAFRIPALGGTPTPEIRRAGAGLLVAGSVGYVEFGTGIDVEILGVHVNFDQNALQLRQWDGLDWIVLTETTGLSLSTASIYVLEAIFQTGMYFQANLYDKSALLLASIAYPLVLVRGGSVGLSSVAAQTEWSYWVVDTTTACDT